MLRIRRTVCKGKLRPLTKTRKARIVGVPEVLRELLRSHREQLIAAPLANSRISDALQDACKAAGIKRRFTSHGFRRTLTDLLRNAQVDPVVAAGLTGHETERMRRHYSTVRTSEAVEAGERVVRLLQPQSESIEESTQESDGATDGFASDCGAAAEIPEDWADWVNQEDWLTCRDCGRRAAARL